MESNRLNVFRLCMLIIILVFGNKYLMASENAKLSDRERNLKLPANSLIINAKGTQAEGEFAHFKVFVNGQEIGEATTTSSYENYFFDISIIMGDINTVKINFDNDTYINDEDRNLYVQNISINNEKIEAIAENVTYKRKDGTLIPYKGVMGWEGDLIFEIKSGFIPIPYKYTSFERDNYDMFLWEGENIVMLTQSANLDGSIMNDLVNTFDDVYDFYYSTTGKKPYLRTNSHYNEKIIIAEIEKTCGAGCGFLGFTGIEIKPKYFNLLFNKYRDEGKYDQILFYEFGRNFWFYGDSKHVSKIEYRSPEATGVIPTGYAVFMRFMSMTAVGIDKANYGIYEFDLFENEVKLLIDTYLADPTLNWENTLKVGIAPESSPIKLGATDFFASFLFRLYNLYGDTYLNNIWKEVDKRPNALNTQDAVDNFILASCVAANKNLINLFTSWRWPISQNAIFEANNRFGKSDLIINTKGTQAGGEFAHFKVFVNNEEVGEATSTGSYKEYSFNISAILSDISSVKITFDNDALFNGEDRNLYVQSITIGSKKLNANKENVTYQRTDGSIIPYTGVMPWAGDLIFDIETESVVCEGYVTLSSQAEVDAFSCKEIIGSLTISGSDITNLEGLIGLKTIVSGLNVQNNPLLLSLDGLQVENIVNDVTIRNNSELTDISALQDIPIGFSIDISENPSLENLNGLQHITGVRSVEVAANESLKNLDGLSSLTNVRNISISDNASLENINGLSMLTSVEYGGEITRNSSLTEFCGLYNLVSKGDRSIDISDNAENLTYEEILAAGPCSQESKLIVIAKGSQAGGEFAHFKVYVNDQEVGDTYSSLSYETYQYDLSIDTNAIEQVKITFDNDALINGEDRNLYVVSIVIGEKEIAAIDINVTYKSRDGTIIPYNSVMPWNGDLIFDFETETVVCEGDVTLSSQAEVDAFNCTEVTGTLIVKGDDITNLDGLSGLKRVGADLRIFDNPQLKNIQGLSSLAYIQYNLEIDTNEALESLEGLEALKECMYINIIGNSLLQDLKGLGGLKSIASLAIIDNINLKNTLGFNSLEGIFDILHVEGNQELLAFNGFDQLSRLPLNITFRANTKLSNFNFLSTLNSVEFLTLQDNESMQNLDFLSSLSLAKNVRIGGNDNLLNVNGLSNLQEVYLDFEMVENRSLIECCGIYQLLSNNGVSGNTLITNNGAGCTVSDILANGSCIEESTLVVNVKGSTAAGINAHYLVYVNDLIVGTTYTSSTYQTHQYSGIPIGKKDINFVKITFDNDAWVNGEDRNLYVQSIEINGNEIVAAANNVTYRRTNGNIIPYNGVMPCNGDLIFDNFVWNSSASNYSGSIFIDIF